MDYGVIGLTPDEVAELRSFEQQMGRMHFLPSQVNRMVRWKLRGDEVFIKEYFGIDVEPIDGNAKQLTQMLIDDEKAINDEGYRIVKPLQREFAYHMQADGIGVTVVAVRCEIKQK